MPEAPFSSFAARVPPVTHVFVYGTLRAGQANDIRRLRPLARYVGTARAAGTLFHLGAYPGMVLGGALDAAAGVLGEVYAITPALERQLDAIEGVWPQPSGEYTKAVLQLDVAPPPPAPLAATRRVLCLCYLIEPGRAAGAPVIPGGDWTASSNSTW